MMKEKEKGGSQRHNRSACGLFNDAVNSSDYVATYNKMIDE
jgi:hypothetical protein